VNTGVIIPFYERPSLHPADISTIGNLAQAHPNVPIVVIVNPGNGPFSAALTGQTAPDPEYTAGITALVDMGVKVIGYIHTAYDDPQKPGYRPLPTVKADIDTWHAWYRSAGLSGIFVDEMSNISGKEGYYSDLTAYIKAYSGFDFVVGNPGADVPNTGGYVGTVDNICIYENPVNLPTIGFMDGWHDSYPKSNWSALVYSYSGPNPSVSYLMQFSQHAQYIYVEQPVPSDQPTWSVLSSYLTYLVTTLDSFSSIAISLHDFGHGVDQLILSGHSLTFADFGHGVDEIQIGGTSKVFLFLADTPGNGIDRVSVLKERPVQVVPPFTVKVTAPGGSPIDYSQDVQSCSVIWPATTALPTCHLVLNNQSGKYSAAFPLFSQMAVQLPANVGTFNFFVEKMEFGFTAPKGGGPNTGHTLSLTGTAAPDLLYLSEGNLDVVGTDLSVGVWNARTTDYVPYPSVYVPSLNSPLQDIGGLFRSLLHIVQPNQRTGYRGRLGYDCTGAGVISTLGVDYTAGLLGLYVKGMWKAGLGSTGSEKSGFDLIKDACQNNVIDSTGTPQVADFYVDNTVMPSLLTVFKRGSKNSNVTFTIGTDLVQSVDLPVDTTNVRNFIIYWSNAETAYPNTGDGWSNYDTKASFDAQWDTHTVAGTGAGVTSVAAGKDGIGTSNVYNNSNTGSQWEFYSEFDFAKHGYAEFTAAARGVSAISFQLMRFNGGVPGDGITIQLYDVGGTNSVQWSTTALPTPGTWGQIIAEIPATGVGTAQGWSVNTGSWDFATTVIGAVALIGSLGASTPAQSFFIDYLQFTDNWDYSPTYSFDNFNPGGGATNTTIVSLTTSLSTIIPVVDTAGLLIGQDVVINPGAATEEVLQITAITLGTTPLLTVTPHTAFNHSAGEVLTGATHDPESVAAYWYRIFNFVDFYIGASTTAATTSTPATPGGVGSDTAMAVAINILNARKAKSSSGTIKLDGHQPGISAIKPGYRFKISDFKDVYVGAPGIDSTIDSWVADSIEYDLSPLTTEGFTVTITVEPYYTSIASDSPDRNQRNLWAVHNKSPAGYLQRLNKGTKYFGVQR
jgi:hypothetical protein